MENNKTKIPFNKPFIVGKELYNIAQAVVESHLSGDGPFTGRCQKWLEERLGCVKALLTHSCTGALEMAAMLCGIRPGDEIIMPSFTFVSTANAFVLRGGVPVFVDVREDTLNIDENLIEQAITRHTKAIVPVHYAGVPCAMDKIMDIAKRNGLFVVEDAAHALLSTYKDRFLGTIGHFGCLSFHETKNIISGEGGALIINEEKYIEQSEILWQKGTNRKKFFRGEVDKYTWVDIGSSFLPSELVGAFLYAQLEQAEIISRKREWIFRYYAKELAQLEDRKFIRLPFCPNDCKHSSHLFYVLISSDKHLRNQIISYLNERGINVVFHYVPLHTSPMGLKMGYKKGDLPITEDLSERLIRLPCYFELKREDQDRIISEIYRFFDHL
jgi:dTDP-4-amino-4,6-dideoxygalactose transaminase